MTREEIFNQLYSTSEVYRPPLEMNSALLEVTSGCSYGRCRFCDFGRDSFHVFPIEEIRRKIELLSLVIDGNPNLHFLGCNPLCLPEDMLLEILGLISAYLPSVHEISMYARADDILRKGPLLYRLRQAGITALHVGLESGCEDVLALHNKGESAAQISQALKLLDGYRISYHLTAIPGLGGKELSERHAIETARLLSSCTPLSIWCIALKLWPDTPLWQMVERGEFHPLTPLEILNEEQSMIKEIHLDMPCLYVDSSVLNKFSVVGMLPESKDALLARMEYLGNNFQP